MFHWPDALLFLSSALALLVLTVGTRLRRHAVPVPVQKDMRRCGARA